MFGNKCKCDCKCESLNRLTELKIDSVEQKFDMRLNLVALYNNKAGKVLYSLLNHLDLEIVPDSEKEKVPEIQFRKRKPKDKK